MLDELQERFHRNLFQSVIPFWERHSLDRKYGGQFNCLTREGTVFDPRKYVWMQGRAVWMFSRLYNEYAPRPEWLEAARLIFDFLIAHAEDDQGRCYFSLTREGKPVFQQRKPYAAFFLALALIEYSKTGAAPPDAIPRARLIARHVREWIGDGSLLGRPALSGQAPVRQLADIMVEASLALELHAVDPRPSDLDTLRRCLGEVRAHWLPSHRTLLENLPLNCGDYRALPETRLLCPGSAIEVSWFLLHAADVLGDASHDAFLLDVIEGSLETGWDPRHGGLLYFMDAEGHPPLQLEADMKLWWPHTEALYGTILAYTRTRDHKWLPWIQRIDEYTFNTFVDWEHGEWFGYCDRQGRPANQLKGGPYKCFFHVPRCLLFSLQRVKELG